MATIGSLAIALAMLGVNPRAALADGGVGGHPRGSPGFGGAGGTATSPNGGNGSNDDGGTTLGGGGGGGGGVSLSDGFGGTGGSGGSGSAFDSAGGNGGNGGNFGGSFTINTTTGAPVSGGAGGNGANSAPASFDTGGGGGGGEGGGGALLIGPISFSTLSTVTGGNGGAGGSAANAGVGSGGSGSAGGAGGDGGIGVAITGGATFTNQGSVTAGNGGAGGAGGNGDTLPAAFGYGGGGGKGGNGGAAVLLTNGGTVDNFGSITGGAGQIGGTGGLGSNPLLNGPNGAAGAGGAGIIGANINITNGVGGTISGGLSGDGATRANAITFTGGTNTLQFGGAASGLTGNIDVSGSVNFNQSGTATTVANVITGTGSVIKSNSGTITLAGANTYTGTTTVNGGLLAGGAPNTFSAASATTINSGGTINLGSFAQTINSVALAGGTLTNGSLTGAVSSTGGSLSGLSGAMTLTLTGGTTNITGTNSFTGATTVNGGLLSVNGTSTGSAITVNTGGTLGGNGTVGNTTINGGTLSPGNSIGTLTVQGNLVFTSAASYLVEVSPANADRTNVSGSATLGGATVNATFAAGTYVARQYTIVSATGGVSGTFGSLANTNLPAGFTPSLSYDANNAYLNLTLNFAPPPSAPNFGAGLNGNQQSVANALVNFFNTTGGIPLVFGTLTPAGLTQVSGELGTAAQQTTFDAMSLFMGLLTDPFVAGRGDPVSAGGGGTGFADEDALSYAARHKSSSNDPRGALAAIARKAPPLAATPFAQRWSVWAAGFGGTQTTNGDPVQGSNTTTSSVFGTAVGADYRFSPDTLAGFALAGGGTNFSVANGLGSGHSDLFQAGAFLRHNFGPAYLSGALAYGWQDITTNRTVTAAGFDQLRARFDANALSGRVEGGYRFVAPWIGGIGITPYAAGQFTSFALPAYAEAVVFGSPNFALAYGSKSVTDSRSELGVRSDKSFAMADGILTLRSRLAWAHDFDPDRAINATFQTLPGATFTVNGARQARDAALTTASLEMKWLNGWSAAATFEGEFSAVTTSYAGKGLVRYAW